MLCSHISKHIHVHIALEWVRARAWAPDMEKQKTTKQIREEKKITFHVLNKHMNTYTVHPRTLYVNKDKVLLK